MPSHACVPDLMRCHREGTFDRISNSLKPEMSLEDLARCEALWYDPVYIERNSTGAHDPLESIWMALANGSAEKALIQGLIQLANGHPRIRMKQPQASRRLLMDAGDHIARAGAVRILEIDDAHVSKFPDSLDRKTLEENQEKQGQGD